MASIEDFVNNRWADAKEELRGLDPEYVGELEEAAQLNAIGLLRPGTEREPRQRLSSEWHNLLSACHDMTRQVSICEASAKCLVDNGQREFSIDELAKQSDYHFRSWAIHIDLLCVHVLHVSSKTVDVYIPENDARRSVRDHIRRRVDKEIRKHEVVEFPGRTIRELRNQYIHPLRSGYGTEITREQLWENVVAGNWTPQNHLDDYWYPEEANKIRRGHYARGIAETRRILGMIGLILHDLENEINP